MITRTLSEYNIHCSIDDNLRAAFKTKLWRVGQKVSKAGSIARKKIFEEWKTGINSVWQIQINVDNFKKELAKEKEIAKEKTITEEKIQAEHSKRLRLEEELTHSKLVLKETNLHHQFIQSQLNSAQAELKTQEENKALVQSNKRLSCAVAEQGSVNKKKRQDYTLLSRQQQWVGWKQLHNNVVNALLFLENKGIKATSLTLFLRVTDVLFDLLIMDIRRNDGINNGNYLSQLESFLNNDCHILFRFSISKETKNLQWCDLMGPEKLVQFTKINLEMLFPDILNVEKYIKSQ